MNHFYCCGEGLRDGCDLTSHIVTTVCGFSRVFVRPRELLMPFLATITIIGRDIL